jgi:NADP-dependent 3-hydroxy acid dehydrogenase YdfG
MSDDSPLSGRTAIVTGASSGIGRETARALARDGADVVLAARRESKLDALAEELEAASQGRALPVRTDVQDPDSVEKLVSRTVDELGPPGIVVSNAGIIRGEGVTELSTRDFEAMMLTNTFGSFHVARATLTHLRETGGNLIFVGSFDGKYPRTANPVYAATKWWLRGFARSVGAREGQHGVGVSLVNPTKVRTEISPDGESYRDRYAEGEILEPEEVAEGIAFAARQTNGTASELDLFARDKFTRDRL